MVGRPINPNSARQQRMREAQARQRLHGPSPKPKLATDNGRLVIPPGLVEAIQANAKDRRRTRAENPDLNPFRFDPKRLHPPGSLPPREVQLAMDSAISWAGEQWANGGPLGQVFAEGLAFPGYPYLSELAQRPEYRTAADIISTEMTRKWIKFSGKGTAHQQRQCDRKMAEDWGLPDPHPDEREADEEPDSSEKQEKIAQLEEFLDNLNCRGAYRLMEATDCYFGRAHLFHEIGGNDGNTPEGRDELISDIGIGTGNISRTKVSRDTPLTRLTNVEPLWIYPTTYNAMNPLVRDFYNPSIWYMQGTPVHCSRMFTQIGRPVPDLLKPAYSFGGLSLTQIMQPYVNIWLETRESIGRLIHAFSVMVLSTDMQTFMQPGGTKLMERVDLFNTLRDNNGTFVINKNTEEFKNVSVPLSGLHELQAQSQEHLASIIRVPVAIYTGISPTGLNASSEGEIRIFENAIHAAQEGRYRQNLTKTVNFAQLSLWDEIDPDITFEFVQLRELTEKEEAELRKMDAETDDILINGCQALSPEEVRIRIAGDENGPHAGIDPDDMPEPPQPPPGEGGPPGAEGDGGEQPGEQAAPGQPKPGGRINISGREAYTGVGGDENPFGSTSDDGGGTGGVGPGSPGPTGGTFASLAESDPNAALHPGYATGPLTGVNPAKKKQAHDAEWKEGDHPRAPDGKFGSGVGSEQSEEKNVPRVVSSRKMQQAVLRNTWAHNGRDLDYEDVWETKAGDALWTREVQAWNAAHGTNLDPDQIDIYEGEGSKFAAEFDKNYLTGKKAPFPGVKAANDYFENDGRRSLTAYLPSQDPEKDEGARDQKTSEKASKESVSYRLGTPKQHCGICAMFVDPDKCTSVEGDIKRERVCDLFEPAAG